MRRVLAAALLAGAMVAPLVLAQSAQTAKTSGNKLEFDVASVKPNKSDEKASSNFPLGPGDVYVPNGGRFSATNLPLITYISFAYKVVGNQFQALLSQLPGWVTTDRFDIEARAEGNPTKDQMRLMMRSLLADRFNLGIHYETRQVPVFALVLSKPGTTGPQLRSHPADSSCPTVAQPGPGAVPTIAGGLPELCAGLFPLAPSAPGRTRVGARNVGMGFIASSLSGVGNPGRPVLDQTGLSGTFDFTLEWTPELTGPVPPGSDFQPDPSGPTLMEALKEQLGLKLESQKGPVDVIVVDHVEHPTEN